MTQQTGITSKIVLGFEETFGIAPDTGFYLPVNSCGLVGARSKTVPATLRGRRDPYKPLTGNWNTSGPIVVPADSTAMAYWLMAMFGSPSSSGSGPYVHEFKIGDTMPSFTLEKQFPDLDTPLYEKYVGNKIASFSMGVGGDGELTVSMQAVGVSFSEETSAFDSAPVTVPFNRVENFQAALTEGGATLSNAMEFSINTDFGLDQNAYPIGNSGKRDRLPEGMVAVTGTLNTFFEDKTLLDKALNITETSLKVTVTESASSVLEFEIQELEYEVNGVPVEGPQGLMVNLNFTGFYGNGSEDSVIVARLTNSISGYSYTASHSASASASPSISASVSPSPSASASPS
jgi:hypothetical protein